MKKIYFHVLPGLKYSNMFTINAPEKSEYPEMLQVWESSVRATHHFLKKGEIEFLKEIIVEKEIFDTVNLTCIRDMNMRIVGIMGVSHDNLEMLFIHANYRGRGAGKQLLLHAINRFKITRVAVNEQNEQALQFYQYFGFRIISRSETDDMGNPYPILHMQLQ